MSTETGELAIPASLPAGAQGGVGVRAPARSRPGRGLRQALAAGTDRMFGVGAERLERTLHASAHAAAIEDAWRALWSSRLLAWVAGVGAVGALGYGPTHKVLQHERLTGGFGWLGDLLVAPAARWDAGWYLLIVRQGYKPTLGDATASRGAFFPLYPLLVRALSALLMPAVLAGIVVAVLALGGALYGLHRLTSLEVVAGALGTRGLRDASPGSREVARLAVLLTAFAPMAFFLSAVYSESLYMALSIGVFWCARKGRWMWTGILGAAASATRPTGVLLLAPALILYLYGPRQDRPPDRPEHRLALRLDGGLRALARALHPRYRLRKGILWLALMPAGVGLFAAYLGLAGGSASTPFRSQQLWGRHFAGPFGGLWDGAVAAFDGMRQFLSSQAHHSYFPQASGSPLVSASHNVLLFAFALAALVAVVGVLRTLPFAYGAYVLLALALPLSYPVSSEPLMSFPRFLLVLFPLTMWFASWLAARPRARVPVLALSAISMMFFTGAFATWHWVA
jgi:Mannosyltransferase (PIG-V)